MQRIYGALRKLFPRAQDSARVRPTRNTVKLRIEVLEDRITPNTDFRSVIGLNQVQSLYPYNGQGETVAILDTGIDYNDPALGGGFGPGHRVVAGYDFVNNDANPMDDNGHGTNIAGIIGSSDPNMIGIDPNVNFVALKVLDANNTGSWSNIDSALQWVISHQAQYNIVAVNLSLGSGNYTTNPYSLLEGDFSTLKSMGVFTAVASGNGFYTYNSQPGLAYPATSPNVVSVGATWTDNFGSVTFSSGATDYTTTTDQILSLTQRDSQLSILAPGAWITSTGLNNRPLTLGGTSMAAAVVTGSAVLLHQAYDSAGRGSIATQDNLLALMQSTGVNIVDTTQNANVTGTGLTFKRLNLLAAMNAVGQGNAPPTLAPIADRSLQVGQTVQAPLVASDPENQPLTFTYKQIYLPALAYQIDQQYGLTSSGNYYTNLQGANEKWLIGNNQQWYCLMPNGELRRWAGTMTDTLAPANLMATFNAAYYNDPTKIWHAPYAGMPPAVFSISGSTLSVRSPAYWIGTYAVQVTASDKHNSVSQTFNINQTAADTPPVLAAIANRTIGHAQRPLVVSLNGTDANNDPLTYRATVLPVNGQTPAVTLSIVGNQLTINPAASFVGTFAIEAIVSDGQATDNKTFTVTVNNTAPVLAALANQSISHGQNFAFTLSATDADHDPLTYAATVLPVNGVTPALSVSVVGNQVTLHPTQPLLGTFVVQATVSDGAASATQTFNLTLTNTAPTLGAIANQTMAAGQTTLNVTVPASDADNDTLSRQAAAQTPNALAYQLDQQYGFKQSGANDYFNIQGQNEKWVIDKNNLWYAILPNGKLYRWTLTMAQTLQPANLIATLDPSIYAQPRLLWSASAPTTPALTYTWVGNQLTIQRPATLTGIFFVNVTISDGWATTTKTFQVTLN
jgi:hypothetical protein